jgi:hypothetical protein
MNAREKAAKIAKLRKEIATLEAKLGGLREDLARLEREEGDTSPLSGLDLLWNEALPKSRERSSRQQCRVEWHRLAKEDRPRIEVAVAALRAWNRCEQWTKDANAYAPGLHLFIKRRLWEDVPQVRDPLAKYKPAKPAAPVATPAPDELADADDVATILGTLTRKLRTT